MVQTTISYIKVLYELNISLEAVHEAQRILSENPQVQEVLENPVISREAKDRVINRIFREKYRILSKW